ncbi:MAG: VacJ family lipoprotein [Cardiobacteriaceae bacterium]|nr:VacJ family lipoprotein [Cardiobacteriaceae bacterium]
MKKATLPIVTALCLFLFGCSSAIDANGYSYDPWEPFNRKVFVFNDTLDTYLLKPIATGYDTVTPRPIKTGISNFFGNLDDVGSFANSLVQLEFKKSLHILVRIIDNTVFGLGGLIDVATPMGNPKIKEDFGKTLAHYGVKSGPFLMLPVLGPSTVRDGFGRGVDLRFTAPLYYLDNDVAYWTLNSVNAIQNRAQLLQLEKNVGDTGQDKYLLVRDAWLQYRFGEVTGEQRSQGAQKAIDDIFSQENNLEQTQ